MKRTYVHTQKNVSIIFTCNRKPEKYASKQCDTQRLHTNRILYNIQHSQFYQHNHSHMVSIFVNLVFIYKYRMIALCNESVAKNLMVTQEPKKVSD